MLETVTLALVGIAYAILSAIVYMNNPKASLNRILAGLMVVTPLWVVLVYLEDAVGARHYLSTLVRADYALASAMVGLFYWFCVRFTHRHWHRFNAVVAVLVGLSMVLSASGLTSESVVQPSGVVLQPVAPGYQLFLLLLLSAFGGGVVALAKGYRDAAGREKSQVAIISIGLILTAVTLISGLMIAPRFYDMSEASVTRIGLYGTLFFAVLSTYALVKHRFLDIREAVARSIAYLLLLGVLMVVYVGFAYGLLQVFLGDNVAIDMMQLWIFTTISLVLMVVYGPLKKLFDKVTDRVFYRHDYDYQTVLGEIGDVTSSGIEITVVAEKFMKIIKKSLTSEYVAIHILPHESETPPYYFFDGISRSTLEDMLAEGIDIRREEIIVLHQQSPDTKIYKFMVEHHINVLVKLHTSREVLGYVILGPKQNGSYYDGRDRNLLETAADELALSVQNNIRFQQIQEFNETLKVKIGSATQELRASNRRLREIDASKDEFISMASHQLRTPLTSVKGYISMMLDGDLGKITPEQRKALEEAYNSSQRMVYLIGDFLNLSRLQTGKFELELSEVLLPRIIEEEIAQLRASAQSRGVVLQYEPPVDFPMVSVDETKIRQVMMNFIDNAIYYSRPTGGEVSVSLVHHEHHISFRVRDNGIGVPASERSHLFMKFYRAGNARKARPDGTGIGLYMAKKVIVAHGGSILFESREGEGSEFGFRLPITHQIKPPLDKQEGV